MTPEEEAWREFYEEIKLRVAMWPAWKRRAAAAGLFAKSSEERVKDRRMTKDEALGLIDRYCSIAKERTVAGEVITGLRSRFPKDGSEGKAMRWLGFIQGALYAANVFTLEELKVHSRDKIVL